MEVLSEARNFHEWSDSGRAEQPTANVVSRNANLFLSILTKNQFSTIIFVCLIQFLALLQGNFQSNFL